MSYGFTPQQARDYDAWKTSAPEPEEGPCDRCKLNSCDDCEHSEDWCSECDSTDCKCPKCEESFYPPEAYPPDAFDND